MTAAQETSERELLAIKAELNAKAFCWIRPNGDREAHFGFTRDEVAIIQSALAATRAARDAPAWQPIETSIREKYAKSLKRIDTADSTWIGGYNVGYNSALGDMIDIIDVDREASATPRPDRGGAA